MKKLNFILALVVGMVLASSQAFALPASYTSNKTSFQSILTSAAANGNTAFVTGSGASYATANQYCASSAASTGTDFGTLVSCGNTPITGLVLSGGASGGTVTIYDAATNMYGVGNANNTLANAEVGPQEVIFEGTVAANTVTYIDMHDAPVLAVNGVVAYATSTSGVVVYTSKAIAGNT